MGDKIYYGLKGLQELLNCSRPSAVTYIKSGKIPYSQIGKKRVFQKDQVLKALEVDNQKS